MELESEQFGWQWVWVSMDVFTQNAMNLGVPTMKTGVTYQQYVDNVQKSRARSRSRRGRHVNWHVNRSGDLAEQPLSIQERDGQKHG
eukprot:4086373-Ditylum_brightwellii.AAC.1